MIPSDQVVAMIMVGAAIASCISSYAVVVEGNTPQIPSGSS
jgi:hypothetical protein